MICFQDLKQLIQYESLREPQDRVYSVTDTSTSNTESFTSSTETETPGEHKLTCISTAEVSFDKRKTKLHSICNV